MHLTAGFGKLHLALPLGRRLLLLHIAGAVRAANALEVVGMRPVAGAERHAAGAAERRVTLHEAMPHRHALVEDEALAGKAAFGLGDGLEIFKDAAPQVKNLLEALRQQIGRGLFAADTAGAEHRDPSVTRRIELLRDEILELGEALGCRIDGA